MSILFWRKTQDTGQYRPDGKAQVAPIEVDENNPLPVRIYPSEQDDSPGQPVSLPTVMPPQAGMSVTYRVQIPGIGTASAYTAADAFGTLVTLSDVFRSEKRAGNIVQVVFYDLDDEGLQKDLIFYERPVTTTADNDAYAPSDADLLYCVGVLSLTTYVNLSSNQIGVWTGNVRSRSTDNNLYVRLVTQGADNIAAGSIPWLAITVIPD